MNLKSVLDSTVSRYGNKCAIVYGDSRLSYSFIDKESNRFASALTKSGIGKGDRVALFLSNCSEFIIAFFGITKIGAVALPLDQQYKIDEVKSLFAHSTPSAVISENTMLDLIAPCLSDFQSVRLVIETGPERKDRFIEMDDFLASGSTEPLDDEPSPEDVAIIMYTSSSALQPRGVMLSHRSLCEEARMSAAGYRQTENDVMMMFALPMFHVFGLVSAGLASIYSGSTIVIVPGTGISIGSFMAAIEREKGTMYLGVPFIYALAVDMAEKGTIENDLSSLRICASAGAPLSIGTSEKFCRLYGKEIIDCYGATEVVSHITCPDLDQPVRYGSIGKVLPGWEIRIVDADGNELPPGNSGELLVKGPYMTGYYNNQEETEAVFRDGWLDTGDIGMQDEEDRFYITGRSKETIIVKGQNIYPVDLETVILTLSAVKEVAVLGVPDEVRGEVVMAVILPKKDNKVAESDIRQVCADKLVGYKVPRKIVFTDSMPHNQAGEIDKEALRNQLSLLPVFDRLS